MKHPDHSYEFSELTRCYSTNELVEFFEVDQTTIKRWKTGTSKIPHAIMKLARARFAGDLSEIFGKRWTEISATATCEINIPGFKRPFTPEEVRQTFWKLQELPRLRHEVGQLQKDVTKAEKRADENEKRAEYYRQQLLLEAKMGLALSRITG